MTARQDVSFYKSTAPKINRQKAIAKMLMDQGKQPSGTEMVSGYAVQQSPLAGLARALQTGMGGYFEGQAAQGEIDKEQAARTTMADAMEAYNRSQAGGQTQIADGNSITWNKPSLDTSAGMYSKILMGNEDTAGMGMQAQMQNMQAQQAAAREMQQFKDMMPLQLQMAREKAAIANQMTPYQAAMIELKKELLSKQGGTNPQTEIVVDPSTGQPMEVPIQSGVPNVPMKTGFIGDAKQEAMFKRMTANAAQKRLQSEEAISSASKARDNLTKAKRFEELMGQQKTGGMLVNAPLIGGLMETFDPQLSEMRSIQDKLTPAQREPGSGATSDFDAKMFQSALFGTRKPVETNQSLVAGMKAQAQQDLEYQNFLSDYFQQNNHLDGADAYWKDYVEKNPIFDPTSPAQPRVNPNRKPYQEYFGGLQQSSNPNAGAGNPAINTPYEDIQPLLTAPVDGGLTPEEQAELNELRKRLGR